LTGVWLKWKTYVHPKFVRPIREVIKRCKVPSLRCKLGNIVDSVIEDTLFSVISKINIKSQSKHYQKIPEL
jgi:hypothetical protein